MLIVAHCHQLKGKGSMTAHLLPWHKHWSIYRRMSVTILITELGRGCTPGCVSPQVQGPCTSNFDAVSECVASYLAAWLRRVCMCLNVCMCIQVYRRGSPGLHPRAQGTLPIIPWSHPLQHPLLQVPLHKSCSRNKPYRHEITSEKSGQGKSL